MHFEFLVPAVFKTFFTSFRLRFAASTGANCTPDKVGRADTGCFLPLFFPLGKGELSDTIFFRASGAAGPDPSGVFPLRHRGHRLPPPFSERKKSLFLLLREISGAIFLVPSFPFFPRAARISSPAGRITPPKMVSGLVCCSAVSAPFLLPPQRRPRFWWSVRSTFEIELSGSPPPFFPPSFWQHRPVFPRCIEPNSVGDSFWRRRASFPPAAGVPASSRTPLSPVGAPVSRAHLFSFSVRTSLRVVLLDSVAKI